MEYKELTAMSSVVLKVQEHAGGDVGAMLCLRAVMSQPGCIMTASHDEPMPRACRKINNQPDHACIIVVSVPWLRRGYIFTNIILIPLVHHLDY